MIYLVDTNILLGFSYPADRNYQTVQFAVHKLLANGHQLKVTLQNFAEFWRASTRPADKGGFGRTPPDAEQFLQELELLFPLLPDDSPNVYTEWRRLAVQYSVSGKKVHDARLVASMISQGITHILTFDKDFDRYASEGIIRVDPAAS
ncbi:MAG: type II toxin-antitoxin system VapC family toxin [Candidatus Poribacteria bacterium]|nr:type II toxin-antitoxin system VapC family toxin [Candidatus Poribacteria bacterium]